MVAAVFWEGLWGLIGFLLLASLAVILMVRGRNVLCFFFSSRRRHTRLQGDWSSDVCSSDLRRVHRRLGGRAEELRAELRLRLRGWADGGLARSLAWVSGARAEAVSRETPADRDPVAPHRVADRLHAAAPPPRRRRPAHARGEGVRQGRRGAADEARARPAALRAVFRVAGARVAGRLRRVALGAAAGAPGGRPTPARH